jgi:uncharacterized SAM-binding protein YcdF (DUF218 family)
MMRRGKRFLKIAVILFTLLVLLIAAALLFPQAVLCVDSGPAKADAIIVLGGGDDKHERPERAAELFFQHAAPRIIVSGAGDDEMNYRALLKDGVPPQDIEVEGNSRTTRQNALFSAQMMRAQKLHSAIIVTSWYHSRRALKTFRHFAPDLTFYSRPSYYNYHRGHWGRLFVHHVYWEFIKVPGYWIEYGVCPF